MMQSNVRLVSDTSRRTPMPNLTDTLVRKALVPAHTKKTLTKDAQVPRLFLQITRDGAKSFVIRYSCKGRERLMTIGRHPIWTPEMARARAKELLQQVDMGVDPLASRIEQRGAPTVKDLTRRFLEEHAPTKRPSYLVNNSLILKRYILP